jgi:hypothetical protein
LYSLYDGKRLRSDQAIAESLLKEAFFKEWDGMEVVQGKEWSRNGATTSETVNL